LFTPALSQTRFPGTGQTLSLLKEIDEILELGSSDDDNHYGGNMP
jgi:hypothetical protein